MTFGLLTAGQMALLATLTAAAVVAIFFLKVRHPLVVVPSLLLWQNVLDDRRRESLLERLRRLISLLLALAIALALAFASGEPRTGGADGGQLALVIDNTLTMQALTPEGETRLARARDAARALVDRAGGDARFQISDTTGVVRTPAGLDRQEARDAIDRIVPGAGPARMPPATDGYERVLFTDGIGVDPPEGVRLVSLAGRAPNVGIAAFEIRATPARPLEQTALVSIVNFNQAPREVRLSIGAPGRPRAERTLPLAAGASFRELLPVTELDAGIVEVRIASEGDRYPLDDVAYGWLPDRRVWRVALVSTGEPALEAALGADPRVALDVVTPDAYRRGIDADILVFDRFAPDAPPARPSLVFAPTSTAWLPMAAESRTLPAVNVTAPAHPLLESVDLTDLHVEQSAVIAASGATALAADDGHAIVATGRADAPWVAVGFALDQSNFTTQPAFPIFLANVLASFRGEGAPIAARPGLVEVPWEGAAIADASGAAVPAVSALGVTRFAAPAPGVYLASGAAGRAPIVVNATAGLNPDAAGVTDETVDLPATGGAPWWTVLAVLALALAALEWWTWQRRITV